MPHGGLRRSRGNPALAQQRSERGAQGVNVEAPAAVVAFVDGPLAIHFHPAGDAGGNKVAVKDLHQPSSARRTAGYRAAAGPESGRRTPALQLATGAACRRASRASPRRGHPARRCRSLRGSFRRRRRGKERNGVVKAQVRHGEGSQLGFAKAGQHQRLVDQRPFPPEPVQPFPHFGAHLGVALAFAAAPCGRSGLRAAAFPWRRRAA